MTEMNDVQLSADAAFHREIGMLIQTFSNHLEQLYASCTREEVVVLQVQLAAFKPPWRILDAEPFLGIRRRIEETWPGNSSIVDAWDLALKVRGHRPVVVAAFVDDAVRVTVLSFSDTPHGNV